MGYDGELELALIPESFRKDALKETLDDKNVLVENANTELGAFALLFEFDGDIRHIRHIMYAGYRGFYPEQDRKTGFDAAF
jgi:hypothetical protein